VNDKPRNALKGKFCATNIKAIAFYTLIVQAFRTFERIFTTLHGTSVPLASIRSIVLVDKTATRLIKFLTTEIQFAIKPLIVFNATNWTCPSLSEYRPSFTTSDERHHLSNILLASTLASISAFILIGSCPFSHQFLHFISNWLRNSLP